jgi:hypothetical protein
VSSQAEPLTAEERAALQLQARNPGPLVPFLRQRWEERAYAELAARQAALKGDTRAIRPENPYDPTSRGYVARMGRHSRAINRPQPKYQDVLRPGHDPYSSPEAECIDAPEDWRRGRL